MTFVKTKPKEEGIGIFDFAALAIYKIGFPFFFFAKKRRFFRFWFSLQFVDFPFFSIWFSVLLKNTNGCSDLVSDVVLVFPISGFFSI